MEKNNWAVALQELLHVGGTLVLIIAVVVVLTGIIREYIPQEKLQKKLAKHEKRGPLVGALLGTLTPFCSASMVPVVMGMIEMKASMGMVFGFLISAPLCNFVVVGLVLAVFGWEVALLYFALTLAGTILAGYVIGLTPLRNSFRRISEVPVSSCSSSPAAAVAVTASSCQGENNAIDDRSGTEALQQCMATACAPYTSDAVVTHKERMRLAMRFAWALFKRIIPYVLIGAVISALSAAFLPAELVEEYIGDDNWYAIPVAAAIGVPLYLRIEMAIPLLQVLIAKGMGMGAAMALLIGGTGASLPEIAIISSVLKPKAVVAFVITVIALAIVGGVVFSVVF
ncbi:MAG: uncharacterized membrane protein YraQ (UPF0718 family) [Pseudomonadales bacterium]|jgi:uncharacterized membrane protein YraQ (UPF0718 family)